MEFQKVKMVVWKEFNGFRVTSEQNYNARITDCNKILELNYNNGFKTIDDAVEYVAEFWQIDRENIIVKE